MVLTGESGVLGEKPATVPIFPPQIPRGLSWDRTLASAVGRRPLTALAMAYPLKLQILHFQLEYFPKHL